MTGPRDVQFLAMGTRRGRSAGIVLALTGALFMGGCGDDRTGSPVSPAASAQGTGTASAPPTASGSDAELEARATSRFIPLTALGEGWRESQPPPPGFGLTVCGVDIEPEEPLGSARQRFTKSAVGPFVAQYVQAHREGLADEVVRALQAALPTCTTFETRGESPTSPVTRFDIEPVDVGSVPGDTVVWRMTSQGEQPITQDVALVADGEFLIGVVSYVAGGPPDPAVVSSAVAAIPDGD